MWLELRDAVENLCDWFHLDRDQQREENYEEYLRLLKDSNLSFASS